MPYSEAGYILVVDDSPTNLAILSETLSGAGLQNQTANDGTSALLQAMQDLPELILLDIEMPGLDGFETCVGLKSNPKTSEVPVIFITSSTELTDRIKGLSLGAVDYITKPFNPDEVIARIQIHLRLRHLTQQLSQQKQQLEQRVQERTAELSAVIADLQTAQLQLVQSEKMSSIGQLVAGVAHEINNPIGFLSGNLDQAKLAIQDLVEYIQVCREKCVDETGEMAQKAAEIDLDYLLEDIPKMLTSMRTGVDRIRSISTALRTFSRTDSESGVLANIHEGLDSALMILQHRLKASTNRPAIVVNKQYGELPLVKCYLGQLNQVFMNVLANAIDALEEQSLSKSYADLEQHPNTINLLTELSIDQSSVVIHIADNGPGISEAAQARIFEPFFTTKSVGKGTGLGLSISHQIIAEKHGGTLRCFSSPKYGTEFVIKIPLQSSAIVQD